MSEHRILLKWALGENAFGYLTYPRNHEIAFKDGAARLTVSAAAAYKGDATKPDPEDLLVAALSSCHMLSFLALATKKKLNVESYEDEATGFLENDGGRPWIAKVILRPKVTFTTVPDAAALTELHDSAHRACFIANSVKTAISVEPR
jgi:organic hydroperoxide reductase OsmC/OhrA